MRRLTREAGVSLIEALVAMTLFAIGSTAICNMLVASYLATQANTLSSHAVVLATQEREDLRSIQYANIASRDVYTSGSPHLFNGAKYTMSSTVQVDTPAVNMRTVTVTVGWTFRGSPRSYSTQTIFTNING